MKIKKNYLLAIFTAIILIVSVTTVFTTLPTVLAAIPNPTNMYKVVANSKDKVSHVEEYAKLGIQISESAYYYKEKRVGIFIDTRSVRSFENFFMGKKETSNICFVSNSDGSIVRLELINKKVADTILNQLDASR